jgi:predicted nucleic acid-binding protein
MARLVLIETDGLVEYLRGQPRMVDFLERLQGELCISAMTVAELFAGARSEEERVRLDRFLLAFKVIPVELEVGRAGGIMRQEDGPRYGTGLADALIAATARQCGATLVTSNLRHDRMLDHVQAPEGGA